MRKFQYLIFLSFILVCHHSSGQDTLPHIKVVNYNGNIVVSWKSNYKTAPANITIQRSFDSLKNYTTIGSVLNPQNIDNGYSDQKPPYNKMYYRVFISFPGGQYVFSEIRRPVKDTVRVKLSQDTGISIPVTDTVVIVQEPRPKGWVASKRIFTGKENNVIISLPDALYKKYSIRFFDEDENPMFNLPRITETYLIIEKPNFIHSGWFFFELYENGVLVEKNKFFVAKDGRSPVPTDEKP